MWNDLAEAFSDFKLEVDEIMSIDGERFLTVQRFVGHFRATEIPFDGGLGVGFIGRVGTAPDRSSGLGATFFPRAERWKPVSGH